MEAGTSTEPLPLTVVVPVLDEASTLPRLLEALGWPEGGATGHGPEVPEEVLVVDGGSADGTPALAERHGARLLRGRAGRGAQLALGAAQARGELLLFLHADTRPEPGSLTAVRDAFEDPELLATGMRQRIEAEGRIYRWIEAMADRKVRLGWVYGDSGLAVRRSAYEAAGGFTDQPLFEDLDLSRRLRRRGAVRLVEGTRLSVSARRWQADGPVRRTARNWLLTLAWMAGVDPQRLARHYGAGRAGTRPSNATPTSDEPLSGGPRQRAGGPAA